jgi:molecular chaperone DnaK (HSP70)
MEEIELAAKTLTNQVYSVIHNKNHIHNIVPTIFFDKEVNFVFNRLISKKKYSYRLKQDLDEYLERKLGISKKTYIVEQVSDYKPKRTKLDNKYQIKLEELKKMEIDLEKQRILLCEELEESKMVSIDLKNVLNRFEVLVKDYKDKLSIKEQQKVDKLLLRTKKQLTNENTNRAKSTINQMLKVLKPK